MPRLSAPDGGTGSGEGGWVHVALYIIGLNTAQLVEILYVISFSSYSLTVLRDTVKDPLNATDVSKGFIATTTSRPPMPPSVKPPAGTLPSHSPERTLSLLSSS